MKSFGLSNQSNSKIGYTRLQPSTSSISQVPNIFDDDYATADATTDRSNASPSPHLGGYPSADNEQRADYPYAAKGFNQQQQAILMEQDESLERVSDSLRTLKNMSGRIGNELEEQSEMLDELGTAMSSTDARMGNVMRKLAKLSRLEDDNRQCTAIIVLLGLIAFLLFILIAF